MKEQTMNDRHTLQVTLQNEEELRVGKNYLQLIVRNNNAIMNFEQVVIRLSAPLGVKLKPSKVKFVPLPANSSNSVPVTLTTKQPGSHPIKIQANTFPKPKEGFLHVTQHLEVYPELDNMCNLDTSSILEEITLIQANYDLSKTSKQPGIERDIYSKYLRGLNRLKCHIEQNGSQFGDFLVYEQRLMENISATQQFGDTENHRAGRSEVIEHLNKLTLSVLHITFNELCGL